MTTTSAQKRTLLAGDTDSGMDVRLESSEDLGAVTENEGDLRGKSHDVVDIYYSP